MKDSQQTPIFTYDEANDSAWVETLDRKIGESKAHWDKKFDLDKKTKKNEEMYLGSEAIDNDDGELHNLDNRIFSSIRTIVPYVTSRITEPEIYPSSNSNAAKKFAEDFEKALYIKAKEEKLRQKVKFALEDAIIRRRGYLKPRYDATTGNFCSIEYVPAESIIIDHKAKTYEEPRYFRHVLDKTVDDLLVMFPDMKDKIMAAFALDQNSPKSEYEKSYEVNEDWCFVPSDEGLDLMVTWSYKKICLGKMRDPNWRYDGSNFLESHMMPLVFFNVLNDGRSYIDKTSFVEQATPLQENVNERSDQISSNAGLGSVGMPVVDTAAIADDQSQYISFDKDTVLELEVPEGKRINDVFDIWKAQPLGAEVYQDKIDSRNSIDNAFGTPNVFRGEQSDNNTLGQDVLVRDQAFGRQQEIVDAIDNAMDRLYQLMAQFLLVYGDEEVLFRFVGENSQFDYVLINTENLDVNTKISVKSGTSMPIDRAQRRMTADKAAERGMIDPLSFWEIMDEGNAEKYAKRLFDYQNAPDKYMADANDEIFNRDAYVDIELLKRGAQPPFREDLPKDYFDHLNNFILSGDLDNPTLDPIARENIMAFVDAQLMRGQAMLGMAETQLPTPEEVMAVNEQTDQLNAQDQQAAEQEAKLAKDTAPVK